MEVGPRLEVFASSLELAEVPWLAQDHGVSKVPWPPGALALPLEGEERHTINATIPYPRSQGQGEERRAVDAIDTIMRCPRDRPQRHRRHRAAPSTPPTGGSAAGNVILSYRFLFN